MEEGDVLEVAPGPGLYGQYFVLELAAPQICVGAPARQRLRPARQAKKRVRQWHWEAVLLVDGVERSVRELASKGAR